jgi:hypothetical protein
MVLKLKLKIFLIFLDTLRIRIKEHPDSIKKNYYLLPPKFLMTCKFGGTSYKLHT